MSTTLHIGLRSTGTNPESGFDFPAFLENVPILKKKNIRWKFLFHCKKFLPFAGL
jgi:hypothetical protein